MITEEVVKAAAGNKENGKEVMMLLLEQRGDYRRSGKSSGGELTKWKKSHDAFA